MFDVNKTNSKLILKIRNDKLHSIYDIYLRDITELTTEQYNKYVNLRYNESDIIDMIKMSKFDCNYNIGDVDNAKFDYEDKKNISDLLAYISRYDMIIKNFKLKDGMYIYILVLHFKKIILMDDFDNDSLDSEEELLNKLNNIIDIFFQIRIITHTLVQKENYLNKEIMKHIKFISLLLLNYMIKIYNKNKEPEHQLKPNKRMNILNYLMGNMDNILYYDKIKDLEEYAEYFIFTENRGLFKWIELFDNSLDIFNEPKSDLIFIDLDIRDDIVKQFYLSDTLTLIRDIILFIFCEIEMIYDSFQITYNNYKFTTSSDWRNKNFDIPKIEQSIIDNISSLKYMNGRTIYNNNLILFQSINKPNILNDIINKSFFILFLDEKVYNDYDINLKTVVIYRTKSNYISYISYHNLLYKGHIFKKIINIDLIMSNLYAYNNFVLLTILYYILFFNIEITDPKHFESICERIVYVIDNETNKDEITIFMQIYTLLTKKYKYINKIMQDINIFIDLDNHNSYQTVLFKYTVLFLDKLDNNMLNTIYNLNMNSFNCINKINYDYITLNILDNNLFLIQTTSDSDERYIFNDKYIVDMPEFILKNFIFYTIDNIRTDNVNIIAKPISDIFKYELNMIYDIKNNKIMSVKKDNKVMINNDILFLNKKLSYFVEKIKKFKQDIIIYKYLDEDKYEIELVNYNNNESKESSSLIFEFFNNTLNLWKKSLRL
jgi:hypothetical protein